MQGILQLKEIRCNNVYCELKPQLISYTQQKKISFIKAWTSPYATPFQIWAKSEDPFPTGDERLIRVWQWVSYDQCKQGNSVCMPFSTFGKKRQTEEAKYNIGTWVSWILKWIVASQSNSGTVACNSLQMGMGSKSNGFDSGVVINECDLTVHRQARLYQTPGEYRSVVIRWSEKACPVAHV